MTAIKIIKYISEFIFITTLTNVMGLTTDNGAWWLLITTFWVIVGCNRALRDSERVTK